jgi:prophage tail gpP-like protein
MVFQTTAERGRPAVLTLMGRGVSVLPTANSASDGSSKGDTERFLNLKSAAENLRSEIGALA